MTTAGVITRVLIYVGVGEWIEVLSGRDSQEFANGIALSLWFVDVDQCSLATQLFVNFDVAAVGQVRGHRLSRPLSWPIVPTFLV